MISAVLQTTLAQIIPNTYMAIGDEEIAAPWCLHKEKESPVNLKEGIIGYEYNCEIAIVDDTPDSVENYKQSIISALTALTGTTVSGTQIDMVDYLGDDPDFDMESKLYTTILSFLIETRNR